LYYKGIRVTKENDCVTGLLLSNNRQEKQQHYMTNSFDLRVW